MRPPEGPAGAEIRPREGMIAGPGSSGRREGSAVWLAHDSEKWEPVFGQDHAPRKKASDCLACRAIGRRSTETALHRDGARRARETYAPLDGAFAQQRGRVVPERLGERVAQIGTRDPDIRQHEAVEAGQHGGLAPGLA